MSIEPKIVINQIAVPTFLYGTAWKEDATESYVTQALQAGFRGIDTANQRKHYYETGVGAALMKAYDAGTITRKDLFLQTKFTHLAGQDKRLPYDRNADIHTQVLQSFESSLEHLHTNYLDSYVLHGPSQRDGLADQDWSAWRAMEKLYESKKVKLLGVSNVGLDQLKELCSKCAIIPSFVQNRCYASTRWDLELRQFCKKNTICYQGFSLLTANTKLLQLPQFRQIVTRYACTPAQLIFSFAIQVQMLPITGTTDPVHMKEDLAAYQFQLDSKDVQALEVMAAE